MATLGVVMDPIGSIKYHKDSTLAMLLAAQARGWQLRYLEMQDLHLRDGVAYGNARPLQVCADQRRWFELGDELEMPLGELDVLLMRKDPPFDMEYIYATYLLEQAEATGCLVVNKAQSLRDANEKLFTAWFPQCTPPTLVTSDKQRIRRFLAEQGEIIVKPLGGMGGASVFHIRDGDLNTNVIIETLTDNKNRTVGEMRHTLLKYGGKLGDAPPGYVIVPASVWARKRGEALDLEPVLESSHGNRHLILLRRGKVYAACPSPILRR